MEEGLRLLFHREGPISGSVYTFPSQQAFLAVVVYGFASFLVLRHAGKRWFGLSLLFMTIGICIVTGLTEVFFQVQYPSDVGAGYVFGGVWLSLNLILMEVFRALPNITSDPR